MSQVLKITNVPGYITEAEFKRIWTQPGLDCQGCSFIKTGPNGETVGYAQFSTPQAAARAENIYQGWQGYGNPEGLRIEFANTEDAPVAVKRPREDVGDDQAFKQGRPMGGNSMAYSGGGGGAGPAGGGFQNPSGPRLADGPGYNNMQPNLGAGAGPPKQGMGNPGAYQQQMQPPAVSNGNPNYPGVQMGQQGYMGGQTPQGMTANPQPGQGGQLSGVGAPGLAGQPGQGSMGPGHGLADPRGMMGGQGGADPRGMPGQGPPQGLAAGPEGRGMQGPPQGPQGMGQGPPQGGVAPGQGGPDPRGLQGPPQGLPGPGQGPPQAAGMTTSQPYNATGSMPMNFSSGPGMGMGQPQRQLHMQQPPQYGGQPQGGNLQPPQYQASMQGQGPGGMPPQQQQQNPMQGQPLPQGGQYNPNAPGMHPGNAPLQYGSAGMSYDPHNPQIAGGQQGMVPPQQQMQQQQQPPPQQPPQQQQPPQGVQQIAPQQLASIADVLGPLLQQQGIQGLGNINLGQLQQGLGAGLAQQGLMQTTPAMQPGMGGGMSGPVQLPAPLIPGQISTHMQAARLADVLPPDAVETLYVDNMSADVTKREMAHVFRPFEGFKEMRLVERKDKNGTPLVIGFAEFVDAQHANVALKALQGYPLEMTLPAENQLRLSFAKPLKASDPRSRGQNKNYNNSYSRPAGMQGNRMADDNTAGLRGERGRDPVAASRMAVPVLPSGKERDGKRDRSTDRPARSNFSNGPDRGDRRPDRRPRY